MHYAMDSLRHGDYWDDRKNNMRSSAWKVLLDFMAAMAITASLVYLFMNYDGISNNILLGVTFSLLPDLFTFLYKVFPENPVFIKLRDFNYFAHRYNKIPKNSKLREWSFRNFANDFIISVAAIIILFIK